MFPGQDALSALYQNVSRSQVAAAYPAELNFNPSKLCSTLRLFKSLPLSPVVIIDAALVQRVRQHLCTDDRDD